MWTIGNRRRYDRDQLRYPSDLTDAEWALVEKSRTVVPLSLCRCPDYGDQRGQTGLGGGDRCEGSGIILMV